MRLISRAVHPLLVCLAVAVVVQASPCWTPPALPTSPILEVLVPDTVADRWYACRGVAEEDLDLIISLNVMPTFLTWADPPRHPDEVMREALYEMIAEEALPDMAMIPRELAGEIADRCYVYELDAFGCWISWPFLRRGAIAGAILPWACDLVVVFFEPGAQIDLGLSLLSHPAIAAVRPPKGCCDWPVVSPEPPCPAPPCAP